MRRIAFGGLLFIGVAVAAGLVLWLAIFSVHEDRASGAATATARLATAAAPRHAPTATRHAPTVTRHAPTATVAGGACFVGGEECSEIPCTEMIGSTMSVATVSRATARRATANAATKVAPSVSVPRLETPVSGCGTHRALPHATVVNQAPLQAVPATDPYARTLKSLRAQLSRRFP